VEIWNQEKNWFPNTGFSSNLVFSWFKNWVLGPSSQELGSNWDSGTEFILRLKKILRKNRGMSGAVVHVFSPKPREDRAKRKCLMWPNELVLAKSLLLFPLKSLLSNEETYHLSLQRATKLGGSSSSAIYHRRLLKGGATEKNKGHWSSQKPASVNISHVHSGGL
jgi:hypothetical protein